MNKTVSKVRTHIKENKNAYITGSVCLVVGAAAAVFALTKTSTGVTAVQKVTQIGLRNENTSVLIQLVERSTPSKAIRIVGTNQFFNSIHEASRLTGISRSAISNCINGLTSDAKGVAFELIDVGADLAS